MFVALLLMDTISRYARLFVGVESMVLFFWRERSIDILSWSCMLDLGIWAIRLPPVKNAWSPTVLLTTLTGIFDTGRDPAPLDTTDPSALVPVMPIVVGPHDPASIFGGN